MNNRFVEYSLLPLLIFLSILWTNYCLARNISAAACLGSYLLLATFFVFFLERKYAFRKDWSDLDREDAKDILHSVLGTHLGALIGGVLNLWLLANFKSLIQSYGYDFIWPTHINIVFQVIFVALISDFGRYWQHQSHHRNSKMWLFHELHHSGRKMNVLKATRSHFVERVIQQVCMYLPLFLLGVSSDALLYFLMVNSTLGILSHANLDIRSGSLDYVLMTPANHKIHHSLDMIEGNSNFGGFTVVWDRVFGTFIPSKKVDLKKIDVGVNSVITPESLKCQIVGPFKKLID